jgi:hypothetical protein
MVTSRLTGISNACCLAVPSGHTFRVGGRVLVGVCVVCESSTFREGNEVGIVVAGIGLADVGLAIALALTSVVLVLEELKKSSASLNAGWDDFGGSSQERSAEEDGSFEGEHLGRLGLLFYVRWGKLSSWCFVVLP